MTDKATSSVVIDGAHIKETEVLDVLATKILCVRLKTFLKSTLKCLGVFFTSFN